MKLISKLIGIVGFTLSTGIWILFTLIQILYSESPFFPIIVVLISAVILLSLITGSRFLAFPSAILSLLPLLFLVYGIISRNVEDSKTPVIVTMAIWTWAIFYAASGGQLMQNIITNSDKKKSA